MDDENGEDALNDNPTRVKTINIHTLPCKVSYFLCMARFSICEYIMLFYVSTGLSLGNAGWINGLQLLGGMVAAPLWSFLADKMGSHKILSFFVCMMAVFTMSLQPILNESLGDDQRTVCPYKINETHDNLVKEKNSSEDNSLYFSLLVAAVIASSFDSTVMSFMDAGVIQRVHTSSKPSEYGHQRLFGGIGYSLGSLLFSAAIDYFPTGHISCYSGLFFVYFGFTTCLAFSLLWLFKGISFEKAEEQIEVNITHLLIDTLTNFHTLFVLLTVLVLGLLQGFWYSFVFVYMKEINSPTLLLGLSTQSETIGALLIYIIGQKLIKYLGGPIEALTLSCISWTLRFMCITHMKSPYVLLVINLLHGICFPLSYLAVTEFIKITSDFRVLTTMCGVRSTLNTTGLIIANLVGGHIYRLYGGRVIFVVSTSIGGFWGIIMIGVIIWRNRRNCIFKTSSTQSW